MNNLVKINTYEWFPTLIVSTSTIAETKAREDKENKMKYKADLDEAMRRKREYNGKFIKAYALLWERCARSMQNKIKEQKDFQSDIYNNPVNLLKAIKQHSQDFQDQRYGMSTISVAIFNLVTLKQKENEPLHKYTRQFKKTKDILE